jgi:hypothetical protein
VEFGEENFLYEGGKTCIQGPPPGEIIAITLPSATLTCSIARNLSVSAFFCNTSSSSLYNKGILRSLRTPESLRSSSLRVAVRHRISCLHSFCSFTLHILQHSMDCVAALSPLTSGWPGAEWQMRIPSGRIEKRSAWAVPVELSRPDLSLPAETSVAENVSPRGARVVSKQRWKEGDRVLVKARKGDLRWPARVVYCETLASSTFAIGLKLLATADWWPRGISGRATGGNGRTRKRNSKFQPTIIRFPRVWAALTFKRRLWYLAATR